MDHYEQQLTQERAFLRDTLEQVRLQLTRQRAALAREGDDLLHASRSMWRETEHLNVDFANMVEIGQHVDSLKVQAIARERTQRRVRQLEGMLKSPYFARIDFKERGYPQEPIYIGRAGLVDSAGGGTRVYDWRAPIASLFYRFEPGPVRYSAPMGEISGEMTLKRQFEISNGRLEYFFDADVQITDQFLRRMLSQNASGNIKAIVETIQRDQDEIIRDNQSDLLIVQGVAGSGKTSVALHRVAYLLYDGARARLHTQDIVILSPGEMFSRYIAGVLPELGEAQVRTLTFEALMGRMLPGARIQTRNQLLESLITSADAREKALMKQSYAFKSSEAFYRMLERLVDLYERRLIEARDIYYDGRVLIDRHSIKSRLLRERGGPLQRRLMNLEEAILTQVRAARAARIAKLEDFATRFSQHQLEIGAYARMLSIRESGRLLKRIRAFSRVDCLSLYTRLFSDRALFYRAAKGFELPADIERIRQETAQRLREGAWLHYEDALALSALKAIVTGYAQYRGVKQLVVDEAQDWEPMHFHLLKKLFPAAKYTVLGDIDQTIEKRAGLEHYDRVRDILDRKKSVQISMNKSFRCTRQILRLGSRFRDCPDPIVSFNRDGAEPAIEVCASADEQSQTVRGHIHRLLEAGYQSIGLLTRSALQAAAWQARLDGLDVKLAGEGGGAIGGVYAMPVYLAKGLEFDAVLIPDAGRREYSAPEDKQLLYVACTRALHELVISSVGAPTRFLDLPERIDPQEGWS